MSGRGPAGGPRVPTWLLAGIVVLCMGGAGWLFFADGGGDESGDDPTASSASEEAGEDRAEGVLSIPDEDDVTDERRRGEQGRDRLDPDDAVEQDEDATSAAGARDLPSVLSAVRGREIALLSASADGAGDPQREVSIAGLEVTCADLADAGRARAEQDVLDEVASVLDRAGAGVVRADSPAACVDARVRRARSADLVLVLRAGTEDSRVLLGRTPASTTAVQPGSRAMAAELAAALGLDAVSPATSSADRALVTQAGAIDLPGGAALALVEVDLRELDSPQRAALALELATALGVTASRADVREQS